MSDYPLHPLSRPKSRSNPQVDSLLELSNSTALFLTPTGQPFVSLPIGLKGHYVFPLRSPLFQYWMIDHYRQDHHNAAPRDAAWREAFRAILAGAHCRPCLRDPVHLRVGSSGDASSPARFPPKTIALDLRNHKGQIVEITRKRWRVVAGSRFHFQFSRGSLPLPRPVAPKSAAADLALLRSLLNLPDPADWRRALAWLLAALRPAGPYPILVLQGPSGSAKSTAARMLRALIDPSTAPLRHLPSSYAELFSMACHNWVLAFDHVAEIPAPVSDALCRLSTGGDFSLKESYDRREPFPVELQRPVVMTVSTTWTARPDLAQRALFTSLPPISPERRRTEADLWRDFESARPRLLGILCAAVSTALGRVQTLRSGSAPCLADAAAWAIAASSALDISDEAMHSALRSIQLPPEAPSLADALRGLMQDRDTWTGTATALLHLLPNWPGTANTLSRDLARLVPRLSAMGILVRRTHIRGIRHITLRWDSPSNGK
jgi:hypothetical protein